MKSKKVYIILTLFSAIIPLNRMYAAMPWISRLFTLNYFMVGWIVDMIQLVYIDNWFNVMLKDRGYIAIRDK